MELTPEQLAKIFAADERAVIARIRAKIEKAIPLTAAERATLEEAAHPKFAGTWDELAAALGVSRKAVQNWRSDPRYRDELERRKPLLERADGRHCVAEWLRFMADHHLKRGAAESEQETDDNAEGEGILRPPRVGGRKGEWEVAIAALDHRKKENAIGVQEGRLLVAADLEVPLGAIFAVLQTRLAQFPARTARYFVGLRDVAEVEERLRDELDADLADIHAAQYCASDAIAAALAAVPFDDATNALCAKLLFDGADRTALMELAGAIAIEALRQLGRRAIANSRGEASTPPPESHPQPPPAESPGPGRSHAPSAHPPPIAPTASASAPGESAGASAMPPRPPSSARAQRKGSAKRGKGSRPKTATAPAEVEASIAAAPRPRVTRKRRQ